MRISVCIQVSNGNSYQGDAGQGKACSHCSFQDFLHFLTKGGNFLSKENQVENREIWKTQFRKGGAHERGLSPNFSEKIGGRIRPGIGPFRGWGLSRASRGLFGPDQEQFLRTSQPRGRAEIALQGPFLAQVAPFWAKPQFAKPPV